MSNVLMREDGGVCVLADLGLAVSSSSPILERPITSAYYRAPEACFPEVPASFQQTAFDLWSYGVLLAALWTGTFLFQITSEVGTELENQKVFQKIVAVMGWPEEVWPEFPQWLEKRKALQLPKEQKPFQDLLRSKAMRRPLGKWPEIVDLIASLVVWNPKMRASAEQCLQHDLWGMDFKVLWSPAVQGLP